MSIDYYYITEYGEISMGEIDTTDNEYIAHDDLQVFVKGYTGGSKITYSRTIGPVKLELIKMLQEKIEKTEQLTEEDFS